MRALTTLIFALLASHICAEGRLLLHAENPTVRVLHPDSFTDIEGLIVAGAYSSADRHGIEGIALIDGILKSKRIQSWGGMLVIDQGKAQIYPTAAVEYAGEIFDLTTSNRLFSFIELAKEKRLTVLQSHLLIDDGKLDLNYIHDAPKFIRRILFTDDAGAVGVWQSENPETLFEATRQLFDAHHPKMAFNLDMGAYDFCRLQIGGISENCGDPSAGFEALTNFIAISYP